MFPPRYHMVCHHINMYLGIMNSCNPVKCYSLPGGYKVSAVYDWICKFKGTRKTKIVGSLHPSFVLE